MKILVIVFILFFACGCDVSMVTKIVPANIPDSGDPLDTTATLFWVAPTVDAQGSPLIDLAGFRIYHVTTPSSCRSEEPVAVVGPEIETYSISNLSPGRHYFSVSAFDEVGNESECAEEVFKDI